MFKKQGEGQLQEQSGGGPIDFKEPKQTAEESESFKLQTNQIEPVVVSQPTSNVFTDISEYSNILRELFQHSSISTSDSLWKLINPENFWFFVNSLYFPVIAPNDINRIDDNRSDALQSRTELLGPSSSNNPSPKGLYDINDDLFILRNRALACSKLGTEHTRDAQIDILAELWQTELQTLKVQNSHLIGNITCALEQQTSLISSLLEPLAYHPEYVTFQTVELEDQQIQKSKQRHEIAARREIICEMCLAQQNPKNNPLLFCRECGIGVHLKCNPLPQYGEEYVCYGCENQIDDENCCAICACVGGLMFPTELSSDNSFLQGKFAHPIMFVVQEGNTPTRIKLKKIPVPNINHKIFNVLIHASCFKWHHQLYFDQNQGKVKGFANIKEKKNNSLCGVCQQAGGHCIECQYHGCQRIFHPECARRNDVYMTTVKQSSRLVRQIFCDKHRQRRQYETMEQNRWKRVSNLQKLFESIQKINANSISINQKKPKKRVRDQQKSQRKSMCVSMRGSEMPISQRPQCENCLQSQNVESVNIVDTNLILCDNCL